MLEENEIMEKSLIGTLEEIIDRIQASSCRITIPYSAPSPLTVMFDGDFSEAELIKAYPATLHIFGISGHVSVAFDQITTVDHISRNKYVINFDTGSQIMDMLVKILD